MILGISKRRFRSINTFTLARVAVEQTVSFRRFICNSSYNLTLKRQKSHVGNRRLSKIYKLVIGILEKKNPTRD